MICRPNEDAFLNNAPLALANALASALVSTVQWNLPSLLKPSGKLKHAKDGNHEPKNSRIG